MTNYEQLNELAAAPDPQFEEFLSYAATKIPALCERTSVRLPIEGLKRALKVAYTAGKIDAVNKLLAPIEPEAPEEIS